MWPRFLVLEANSSASLSMKFLQLSLSACGLTCCFFELSPACCLWIHHDLQMLSIRECELSLAFRRALKSSSSHV